MPVTPTDMVTFAHWESIIKGVLMAICRRTNGMCQKRCGLVLPWLQHCQSIVVTASDKPGLLLTDKFEGCGTNLHDAAWRGGPAEASVRRAVTAPAADPGAPVVFTPPVGVHPVGPENREPSR